MGKAKAIEQIFYSLFVSRPPLCKTKPKKLESELKAGTTSTNTSSLSLLGRTPDMLVYNKPDTIKTMT